MTPNQNTGCNVGIVTAVIVLVAVGGVVAFLVSGGEGDFLPGFIIPLILIFVVVPIIGRAVKNAKGAAQGGGSSSSSQPASSPLSSQTSHRPYRYGLDTGETSADSETSFETNQAPTMDEEEHRRAVSEIMARRKREAKTEGEYVEVEMEPGGDVEYTEEETAARRQQSRDRSKSKLSDIAQSIRERNRQVQRGADTDLPPGYTLCVNCGNITKLTGRKTRCSTCGSVIEAV
ncbi:MAG TPA: hypothetical protein VM054_10815 [bacterium]|nr:hypothetical protein [bacterium]